MSNQPDFFQIWKNNPAGLIPQGAFCQACGRFNSRCTTVEIVVVNEQKELLLIQRKHDPKAGFWALPAGYLEWHETLREAVVRELREETGVNVPPEALEFVDIFDSPARDADGRENVGHCFLVSVSNAPPLVAGDDAQQVRWFSLSDLPDAIAFDHRHMIERAVQRK